VRQSNAYTFGFITVIAVAAALILSVASQSLRDRQMLNMEADMKRNIVAAVGLMPQGMEDCRRGPLSEKLCCDITACYRDHIVSLVINSRGEIVKGEQIPERISIEAEMDKPEEQRLFPIFLRRKEANSNEYISYCIPIVGKGLWSTLYGYLALQSDLNTITGITFYKHGETPGLGAEIEKEWFQKSFIGKKILDEKGELVSVSVVKGKVNESMPGAVHKVDGISGATLTGNGVTKLIRKNLLIYEPYFKTIRRRMVP
jgi:Na+-transporting NADH:ubiquinone oxidoreductase subunit C